MSVSGRVTERGMSLLLEVITGLGIFVCSLLFVVGYFPVAQKSLAWSRHYIHANHLAHSRMETELARPFEAVASTPIEAVSYEDKAHGNKGRADFEVGTVVADIAGSRLKRVTVTVAWHFAETERQIRLTTVKSDSL